MNREDCNKVFQVMQGKSSRYKEMSGFIAKQEVDDIEKYLGTYEIEDVLGALSEWCSGNKGLPLYKDWITQIQIYKKNQFKPITYDEFMTPTSWSGYIEDSDGCGYAVNSRTHEYDCIWKYWWKKDKKKTLKQYGID